jgi:hypothetical protein
VKQSEGSEPRWHLSFHYPSIVSQKNPSLYLQDALGVPQAAALHFNSFLSLRALIPQSD